ncbi:O-antigen ligase family protein [Lacibacter sp. H407]|uniref:O-antigen ligase family protein n=1 Tax=Lacibacter sp. H407 TaxID=3133423 RepID=UPI0030C56B66
MKGLSLQKGNIFLIAACVIICCYYSFQLNPATSPFINYNSALFAITVAAILFLFIPNTDRRFFFAVWVLFAAITIILLQSRTALLSFGAGYLLFFTRKRSYNVKPLLFLFALLASSFLVLSYYKFESTEGRWFIWKNCMAVLSNNWLQGVGWGKFRFAYNEQQANWFRQHGFDNKETMLADNVYYAFNEWIQLAIEIGVPLTICILLAIVYTFLKAHKNSRDSDSLPEKRIVAAFGALFIATLFSYPFFYLPSLLLFGCLYAWVFKLANFQSWAVVPKMVKTILVCILVLLIGFIFYQQYSARTKWKEAVELQQVGYKRAALSSMLSGYSILKDNGDFLFAMGNAYQSVNQIDSALYYYKQSVTFKNDYELHRQIGQLYHENGLDSLAENHLLKAVYIVPNRFKSREMLVDFYVSTRSVNKAKFWANETLRLKEKVPSAVTKQVKEKMEKIIREY